MCPLCQHANFDTYDSCISCKVHRNDIPYEKYDCWSFNKCQVNKKYKCEVFNKDMGKQCFTLQDLALGCKGNENKSCTECAWYKKILENEEIEPIKQ